MDKPIDYPSGIAFERNGRGGTTVRVTNLAVLRDRVGTNTLRDLLRCLLWSDRIISMADLALLGALRRDDPTARCSIQRDVQTMFWFTCGCMREISKALRDLRTPGFEERLTPDGRAALEELATRQSRWWEITFRSLRDRGGFHADPGPVTAGIEALIAENATLPICESEGPHTGDAWHPLAHAALTRGLWPEGGRVRADSEVLRQVKRHSPA